MDITLVYDFIKPYIRRKKRKYVKDMLTSKKLNICCKCNKVIAVKAHSDNDGYYCHYCALKYNKGDEEYVNKIRNYLQKQNKDIKRIS